VRALLPYGEARRGDDGSFRVAGDRSATLGAAEVTILISAGALAGAGDTCRASDLALPWLRRQLLGDGPLAAQHRQEIHLSDGRVLNLAESPLARLAVATAGEASAYLEPHQVEAGERLRRLTERAQLRQRVTMAYDPTRIGGGGQRGGAAEMGDMAADARRALAEIARVLPRDCADVVFDVCGLLKGLQEIESERGWPRRSAKLVLRIGLDQLARHFGLQAVATGKQGRSRNWMENGARPESFG
jgi:hypothetical protein